MSDGLDMGVYREAFLSESAEYLQGIVDALLTLESNPDDLEPVEAVFRAAHSLKGMSATMGYQRTAELTHTMESLMDTVRKRQQPVTGDLIDLVLRSTDTLRTLINEETSGEPGSDIELLVQELKERTEAAHGVPAAAAPAVAVAATPSGGGAPLIVDVVLAENCALKAVRAYMVVKRLRQLGEVVGTTPSEADIEAEQFDDSFSVLLVTTQTPEQVAEVVTGISEVQSACVAPRESEPEAAPEERAAAPEPAPSGGRELDRDAAFGRAAKAVPKLADTQTVRIALSHLDSMVDLMGELVIARSRLETMALKAGDRAVIDAAEEVHRISSDLQREVMSTRMVPVGNIFNRFPRMVRDLARDLGKDVSFEVEGMDIELDRTVLDEILEPLVHLLRNSIDHGVETAAQRAKAGKPERGRILLSASRERDRVLVTVSDDGKGMDAERIWTVACERGLVTPDERADFTVDEILAFTCTPGFSTAETATKVSGRGVGMDVVRAKVEELGGSLQIRSTLGVGTSLSLALPLTLAIIQSLLVRSNGQVYAIPLGAVTEVFGVADLDIDSVDMHAVMKLRDGRVVPLDRLDAVVGAIDEGSIGERTRHVVLMEWGEAARGLGVDELVGRQEIVIKPLAPMFAGIRGLSGATVLGDGSVSLIVDPRVLLTLGEGQR
jgi:two-component system, chemotaxis family, sensor kinase CheA